MNYLLKSKPRYENRGRIISIILVFVFLTAFGYFFPNFLRSISFGIARPLWSIGRTIASPFSNVKGYFSFKNSLVEQNQSLQDQLAALKLKEQDYDLLYQENQNLKIELGRSASGSRILSAVLSKPPLSPYDTFVIDAGTSSGIAIGDKAYIGENIIVGIVTSVTAKTSIVTLFSSSSQKPEAILSRTGTTYALNGKGGGNFQLEVPKDADILWGDSFVFPGLDQSIIANVYYIDQNSQSSFKTVYLRAPVNVFSTKDVFVEPNRQGA